LIEDASINVENWIMNKVSDGMRGTINNTLILGDGVGKPMGVLNPRSGIPICETAAATTAGSLTWQDLIMLAWEIPLQWQEGASYLMNQRTFAQIMTMTDAAHRPIWSELPGTMPGYLLGGKPIHIITQMPDIAPGATPVAFDNWKRTYMIVWRKAVTMTTDIYTAGWCVLFKFEARVGGACLCANAARLLRVR
jgi:HK97 family phage major capsid protein